MSKQSSKSLPPLRSGSVSPRGRSKTRPRGGFGARGNGARARLVYGGLGCAAVLALAYIDGAEEPLHPITQVVELEVKEQ